MESVVRRKKALPKIKWVAVVAADLEVEVTVTKAVTEAVTAVVTAVKVTLRLRVYDTNN